MNMIKATIHNGRIEIPAPAELPEGTDVTLFIVAGSDDPVMSPEEIARVLAAMQQAEPWCIPDEVQAELSDWESKLDRHGIEHRDPGSEDVFR